MELVSRIELERERWQRSRLPLHHTSLKYGSLTRARTWDIIVNSDALYQLSYERMAPVLGFEPSFTD